MDLTSTTTTSAFDAAVNDKESAVDPFLLAAHRVAQHYGLITMIHDNGLDGLGSRIMAKRAGEIRCLAVRLSEIPAKHSENDKMRIFSSPDSDDSSVISIDGKKMSLLSEMSIKTTGAPWLLFMFGMVHHRRCYIRSCSMILLFLKFSQIASNQPPLSYGVPARPTVSPFCDMGLNPTSRDGAYMQWPSASMMFFHPYDHFRHSVTQAAFFTSL
ncbi:hypothetical protein F3Y22_tig00110776pilonHSYRG00016 [Hibiscus syriacus]|uniref:Uncharacterized protein n=1 Tax=Hibiscus syriacus TaxID=106335 RepID=A0A6A2ZSL1_HIBSY|nr:hypothetical protein F3Y22_tig00110776pilonHSYRG00016 [Hibiscus syriacus]